MNSKKSTRRAGQAAKSKPKSSANSKSDRAIDLVDILWRRKSLLIVAAMIGGVLGLAYKFLAPEKFESQAEILLMQNAGIGESEPLSGDSVSDELLATHMKVIQSNRIVTQALGNSKALLAARDAEPQLEAEQVDDLSEDNSLIEDAVLEDAEDDVAANDSQVLGEAEVSASEAARTDDDDGAEEESAPSETLVVSEVDEPELEDSVPEDSWVETEDTELEEVVGALDRDLIEHPSILAAAGTRTPTRYVIDNLYVTRGGTGAASSANTLRLKFRHGDPEIAKQVLDAILAEYTLYVQNKFRDINQEAVDLINEARVELEDEIKSARDEYREFRDRAPFLSSAETGTNIYATSYEERAAELTTVINTIDQLTSRIKHVETTLARLEESGAHELEKLALIDDANAARLGILVSVERGESRTAAFQAMQPERMAEATTEYSSLLTLQSQLLEAEQRKGPQHPEVVALRSQIKEIERFLEERGAKLDVVEEQDPLLPEDVMSAYVGMLKNDLIGMQQNKVDIERQMDDAEKKAKELLSFELENEDLQRQMIRAEDLYGSVVERLRDLNMKQDATPLIQDVIEYPALGEQVSPSLPVAAAIAILSTMLLGGTAILIAELQDKTIHTEAELEDLYAAPVLSHLPDFANDPAIKKLIRQVKRSGDPIHPTVVTYHDPKSVVSEGFRGIRTKLLLAAGGEKKLVAFTSPNQGDGKSTVVSNLAVSLASTGKKILLVDCDMRRASQHRIFHLDNEVGLAEVIRGESTLKESGITDRVENLTILQSGNAPDNPAELLESEAFEEFLSSVEEQFDIVLLDCPPVLPVSDPAIIASLVDLMVLVVTVNARSLPEAEYCNKTLLASGANITGVIVNRTDINSGTYRYSKYGYESPYQGNGYEVVQ